MTSRDLLGAEGQDGIYDNKSGVLPNTQPNKQSVRIPSFDDPTYSSLWKNKPFGVGQPSELPQLK